MFATEIVPKKTVRVRRRWGGKQTLFAALALILVVGFVGFILTSFLQVRRSSLVAGDLDLRDGIRITANVVDVSPQDRVVRLRLGFTPEGKFSRDGNFLSEPVSVSVLGGADVVNDSYEASEIMLPADVRIPLRSGNISMYPLDSYESTLRMEVTGKDGAPVATSMVVEASNPGYRVEINSKSQATASGTRDLTLRVSRAPTTIFFAMFTAALMLTLTIMAILAVFWLLRGGASESVRFIIPLLLILLFAFPAIRSFSPGIPPMGVLVDFLAFFWCEIGLGISVIVVYGMLMIEMRRSGTPKKDAAEESSSQSS
ncbi:MAG: DUF4436 family protein [Verrucomicrobiota bacterium]